MNDIIHWKGRMAFEKDRIIVAEQSSATVTAAAMMPSAS